VLSTESLDDVATLTGEPRDLLERIRRIHRGSTRAVWRTHPSKIRALWYHHGQDGQPVGPNQLVPAAADSWENARASLYRDVNRQQWALTGRGRYILQPCPHCGSRRRLPMLIPEPDGLLCLDCRRDSSAFVWPADAYDRYLELPDCEEREA
jgi:hypothetical protein